MVNLTVSISDDLKAEMDKYSDVNWSEVTRKCLLNYIQNKKSPRDPLEFTSEEVHFSFSEYLRQPSMGIRLRVTNKMDSNLVIDRMFFTVEFLALKFEHATRENVLKAEQEAPSLGGVAYGARVVLATFQDSWLKPELIWNRVPTENSRVTTLNIRLFPPVEMLRLLRDKIKATFSLDFSLEAYIPSLVDSENGATWGCLGKRFEKLIPIDYWREEISSTLDADEKKM
jgi:hypothetical protein